MCGFAGLFLPTKASEKSADISAMLGIMAHRGPDGEKQYESNDKRFQAGFKRLAIIDLETGDQPIVEDSGRRVLLGNGEIYNYLELKRTPQASDYPYRSSGDMEVILPLHAAYGKNFVDFLNGMFALALYEAEPHRLTLTRDRLGIKPLYWAKISGGQDKKLNKLQTPGNTLVTEDGGSFTKWSGGVDFGKLGINIGDKSLTYTLGDNGQFYVNPDQVGIQFNIPLGGSKER